MSIARIIATIRCDGCTKPFEVTLDPAQKMNGVVYGSLDQYVDDMIMAGDTVVFSIQGDHQLCKACTHIIDDAFPDDDASPTYDQVCAALNNAAGV